MAKRNKSALKANRQNIKRREHNRSLRAKLRTGLKGIRKILDAKNVEGAKTALQVAPVAGRQDGHQGHHPQEHRVALQVAARRQNLQVRTDPAGRHIPSGAHPRLRINLPRSCVKVYIGSKLRLCD